VMLLVGAACVAVAAVGSVAVGRVQVKLAPWPIAPEAVMLPPWRWITRLTVVSPMPMPIPISKRTSSAIVAILEEHGIEYWPSSRVTRLDPERHVAHLDDGRQLPYDLFLGIPVHCAPEVVAASALAEDGWIPVDPATFATNFPGVFAIGDVTSAPVPRAGGIAEGEAATVAEVLVSQFTDGNVPPPYDGAAGCYVELGDDLVGRIDVDFLSYDSPVAKFSAPTAALAEEKRAWGSTRVTRWFGR